MTSQMVNEMHFGIDTGLNSAILDCLRLSLQAKKNKGTNCCVPGCVVDSKRYFRLKFYSFARHLGFLPPYKSQNAFQNAMAGKYDVISLQGYFICELKHYNQLACSARFCFSFDHGEVDYFLSCHRKYSLIVPKYIKYL